MSPGGKTENSPRKRPELLPSSVTVTIAVNEIRGQISALWALSCCSAGASAFESASGTGGAI
jgi:hypothetical protein